MANEFIPLPDAAEFLGVCPRTVRRYIHARRLRAYKEKCAGGFQYLFDREDLARLKLDMRTLEPTR